MLKAFTVLREFDNIIAANEGDDATVAMLESLKKSMFEQEVHPHTVQFNFRNADGFGMDVTVLVNVWETDKNRFDKNKVDKAIQNYIFETEDWQFEELVTDVLEQFKYDFDIVSVTEIEI